MTKLTGISEGFADLSSKPETLKLRDFFVKPNWQEHRDSGKIIDFIGDNSLSVLENAEQYTDLPFVFGTQGTDYILGSTGQVKDKTYYLRGGNDFFRGQIGHQGIDNAGDQEVSVYVSGADTVYGGTGADDISGNDGNDYLDAGDDMDADYLYGGNDMDTLIAYLSGSSGAGDEMVGGLGQDTFIIRKGAGYVDPLSGLMLSKVSIHDFIDAGDRIIFEDLEGELYLQDDGAAGVILGEALDTSQGVINCPIASISFDYGYARGAEFVDSGDVDMIIEGNTLMVI